MKRCEFFLAVIVTSATFQTVSALPMTWGGIEEHPAVVNPVLGNEPGRCVSLRGEWEFLRQPMRAPWRNGIWKAFYAENWTPSHTLRVPGCWEAQGVGEPGMGESWDCKWDHNPKPIRHIYMGDGWYRKKVAIPATWKGMRIWLKVGGVRSQGWFWVNDHAVAWVDNYCGSYKYEITPFVEPGKEAKVVVMVSNVLPSRKGLLSAIHRWGGLYRDVEIEATPQSFIDDAWVRGDFDKREAEAHVTVCADAQKRILPEVRVTIEGTDGARLSRPNDAGETIVRLPLPNFRPWSPEHPNLYTAVVELVENGSVVQTRRERFGVRKLEVRGKEFYLNGKPFYVRGFGDDHAYPITGITPADREAHLAHLRIAREAGFNFVRLHTHCEVPEYFEAADEAGILIQPELPYYSDVPTEAFPFDPLRDVTELNRHYRRYPSFAVYSMGNEGSFGHTLDARLHAYVKAMDPDRLKINQDCHEARINPPDCADYLGGPINVWPRGSVNPDRPFVTHEYLNLCVKLDSRLEPRFTGAWRAPVTRAGRAAWLEKSGLDHTWGDRLQDAQHALQRHYQKRGIEAARADPYCDGHIFWTIVDVVVQQGETYTAQGLFNPFWEQKRNGFSPSEFARFNSPSCVLLDVPDTKRVFTSGDTLDADFLFAHFGETPLKDAALAWRLTCRTGGPPVQGRIPIPGEIPLGAARKVASAKVVFPVVENPVRATLTAELGEVSNSWDFWIFPRREKRDGSGIAVAPRFRQALEDRYQGLLTPEDAARAKLVLAEYGSQMAADALARGQRVIVVAGETGRPDVSLGWWWMGNQVGTALANHPALSALPHEGYLSPLLFRMILNKGRQLPLTGLSQDDMLIVGEGGQHCFLYLAQAQIDKGSAILSFGVNLLADTPEAVAMLDGLVEYAASERFAPKSRIDMPVPITCNGWQRTIRFGDQSDKADEVLYGFSRMVISRALKGETELVWETRPVPANVKERPTYDFTFAGGMGYPAQPQAAFALLLNGKKIIDIPEISWKDATRKGDGCTLRYKRDTTTDELGYFTLTVPAAWLTPGKPATLGVTAEAKNSRRWFAVMEE
ncbi:MAG: hypothetical protein IJR99_08385 [Kiritimatiellae bacterium]|nr:hypothetical protein [Kiritimatiellia bacterium]